MNIKSRNNIKLQTNPILDQNSLNSQYITYNKPLFIKMTNETNNNYKTSTISTKINTSNIGSPFDGSNKKSQMNCNISIKEFSLGKNYSNTVNNFFSKDINTSLSSNEENNNNLYETFTPDKGSLFLKDEEEQFTPYLGQKNKNENIIHNKSKENKNYSDIFNNSKEIITRSSLNLKNHLDEKLSNHSKSINKYEKLSLYHKNINRAYKTNNIYINKTRYNLPKNSSNEKIYNNNNSKTYKKVILIQSIYRGYIYRIDLYNKLKNFTCITILCQIFNKIVLRRKKFIFNGWIYLLKKYKILKKSCLIKSNRISLVIKGNKNNNFIYTKKLRELAEQNNRLKIKLSGFIVNNARLKKEINDCKDLESKYNNLLNQFDKLQIINNSIIKENYKLVHELNSLKRKENNNNKIISPQNIIYFQINKKEIKNKDKHSALEISKNVNNFSILNNTKNQKSLSNPKLIHNSSIFNNLKKLDLNEEQSNNKNYRLIIVKKINFIIKKIPKEQKNSTSNDSLKNV